MLVRVEVIHLSHHGQYPLWARQNGSGMGLLFCRNNKILGCSHLTSAQSHSATYKPSPLSFGSPRTSPFRRPESPVSPSTTIRPSTPTHASARPQTPSRLKDASTPELVAVGQWTPRRQNLQPFEGREAPVSPSRKQRINGDAEIILESGMGLETTVESTRTKYSGEGGSDRDPSRYTAAPSQKMSGDTISKLLQGQVREMREAFQILDRDSDGQVNRDDVVDMLGNLGT